MSSLLFTNGRIYRSAWDDAPADSLVVRDGLVVWSGSATDAPSADRRFDLAGATVIPGLTDAHIHLFAIAHARLQVPVTPRDATDIASALALLERRARHIATGKWVFGAGLDENGLDEKRLPTRAEIDTVIPHHPVLIRRFCGHVALVNSAAMKALGIVDTVSDPEGGSFGRAADGLLDGRALDGAAEMIFRAVPAMDRSELVDALRATIEDSARMGLVAAVEAAVGFTAGFDDEWAIWSAMHERGPLAMHLGFMHQLDADQAAMRGLIPTRDADWQSMSLKFFADGIVGARTAAVSEPYADTPIRGMFVRDESELRRAIKEAHAQGWQVAVHCCGDRASDCVIGAYEEAQIAHPRTDPRHRIEHYFVPPARGFSRLKALGALVVTQPSFLTRMRRTIASAFGARADRCYPGRAVLDADVTYVASSDAPTGSWSPWDGIADAVGRASDSGDAIGPGEALTARQAIHSYTAGGAIAMKQEHWRGTLASGMAADLIALDRDPFESDVTSLKATQVLMTVVRGIIVHDVMQQASIERMAARSA